MTRTYIALGSNQGNKGKNLENAKKFLSEHGVSLTKLSSIYETEPWGTAKGQETYLNQVLEANTILNPEDLLAITKLCEIQLGRSSEQGHMQPRVIDVDILYYGESCLEKENLIIPHPAIHERMFVLVPLLEIAEDWIDPRQQKPIWELYDSCRDNSEVTIFMER